MGGNALKKCETRRYQADEYYPLEAEVISMLRADFAGVGVSPIQAYRQKPSFGDMDVIMESQAFSKGGETPSQYLQRRFNPAQIAPNGNVTSFEFRQFQVDLILMPKEEFGTALAYYSWNDLGNLCGRVAHKLGFSLGHTGLKMYYRDENYQFAEVNLSRDYAKCLEFVGYDAARFAKGFDTLEEIYKFAASTPFFNKEIYSLDNRNHTARVRDAKRKTYSGFVTWTETEKGLNAYPWADLKEKGGYKYKEQFVQRAIEHFPEFGAVHERTMAEFARWKEFKAVYNGEIISEATGLKAQDLGMFMKHLKEQSGGYSEDFKKWAIEHKDEVAPWARDQLTKYSKEPRDVSR